MQLLWYEMAKIFWICPCGGVVEHTLLILFFKHFIFLMMIALTAPVLEPQ